MNDKKIVVKIITFLLLFTVGISLCSCGVINTNGIDYIKTTSINMDDWSYCIQSADKLSNVIVSKFTNTERTRYMIQNDSVKIVQNTALGNTAYVFS